MRVFLTRASPFVTPYLRTTIMVKQLSTATTSPLFYWCLICALQSNLNGSGLVFIFDNCGFHNQSRPLTSNSVGGHPHPRFYRILYKIRLVMTLIAIENFIDNASDADVQLCAKFGTGQTLSYVQTDATTPNIVGPTIDCKTVRISAYSSARESQTKGLERG